MNIETGAITEINRLHSEATASARNAVEKAVECGQMLISLKASCKHGEFTKLITEQTSVSPRTARRYMWAAESKDALLQNGQADPFEGSLQSLINLHPKSEIPLADLDVIGHMRFGDSLVHLFGEDHERFVSDLRKLFIPIMTFAGSGEEMPEHSDNQDHETFLSACRYSRLNFGSINWGGLLEGDIEAAMKFWSDVQRHADENQTAA